MVEDQAQFLDLKSNIEKWQNSQFHDKTASQLAEEILYLLESCTNGDEIVEISDPIWQTVLSLTGHYRYLKSLPNRELRNRWAEAVFKIIRCTGYSLIDLFEDRVAQNPKKILFQEFHEDHVFSWTYQQVDVHVREIASIFHTAVDEEPRVAIFSENSVESASCDLACLFFDILNTPLNVYFDAETLITIFDQLEINIAVTDTLERYRILLSVRKKVKKTFIIYVLDPEIEQPKHHVFFLNKLCKRTNSKEIAKTLNERRRKPLNELATVMYTSGSTGKPKGVCFSIYNLITKRFARAAALPNVGKNEVLLCYLPLYHTFGRYLELLGSIYWSGTYVLSGNPSAETLTTLFPKVNPTGFISIPLRWTQLEDKCLEQMDPIPDLDLKEVAFRSVVGNRLRWGLSAAGYLDPKVFHFFRKYGIKLCSGFGMTEATGGITMTPPEKYVDNSHGVPLPGTYTRLGRQNELQISGPYIARYLDELNENKLIPYPETENTEYWLATGDLFKIRDDGFYEIVDRIKDIYKNNKGQTIAPRKVEQKFINVAGVRRAFLVGDAKPYNVLFIVPDRDDPVLQVPILPEQERDYFHQLVANANQDLAPYERVINFTILDRDFEVEQQEITPKGTFNRKVITDHFKEQITELYKSNYIRLPFQDMIIEIPRWFYRDLGILEDDILIEENGLYNKINNSRLDIKRAQDTKYIQIGDLEYDINDNCINLGLFTRQPKLWIGNPSLIAFCPVKHGWDVPFDKISDHIFRPWNPTTRYEPDTKLETQRISQKHLIRLNRLICEMLYLDIDQAIQSIRTIEKSLKSAENRIADVIRRRLEALARHPDEGIRCLAYKILLFDEPQMDLSKAFPAFLNSGLSFLNKESIEEIAFSLLEKRRLDALRRRLFTYRLQLKWPVSESMRQQFVNIFQLLVSFVGYHPAFYNSVRAELASWILHTSDPDLAKSADIFFTKLFTDFEAQLEANTPKYSEDDWNRRLVFDEGFSHNEITRIKKVLIGTTFLNQSIMLAFDEQEFDLFNIPHGGIWISRLQSSHYYLLYRMSVNTRDGKHFDLQLVLRETLQGNLVQKSVHWLEAVGGYPFGPPVMPRLGCYRPELGARSMIYLNEITVWGKIRQFSSVHFAGGPFRKPEAWRKVFVTALSVFYRGWRNSGNRIVPGSVSPNNVVVPELDFRESAKILSLVGWTEYKDPLSLVQPMVQNFYSKTIANFPSIKNQLNVDWIFDACIEALGFHQALDFLNQLQECIVSRTLHHYDINTFQDHLSRYINSLYKNYYRPLSLLNAIERYENWEKLNPMATQTAKEQTVIELYHLYRLDRYMEIIRYFLYRNTYFASSEPQVIRAFDLLIKKMVENPNRPPIQFLELSDLQAALQDVDDRNVFSRMVFPQFQQSNKLDILKAGESEDKHVLIHSTVKDKYGVEYILRPPVEPAEIGQLYRLFFNENYPKQISEQDQHLVLIDSQKRVVGGICYQIQDNTVSEIQGTVVASPIKDLGIGSAIIEDFCSRMASQGIYIIKTHFFMQPFFEKLGFHVDKSWGALVKFIVSEESMEKKIEEEVINSPLMGDDNNKNN